MNFQTKNLRKDFDCRVCIEHERFRFCDTYNAFCEEVGLPLASFVQENGFMLNLFDLYYCVESHGGYQNVSTRSTWHRIAYVLCRASKKQTNVSKTVEKCFRERLMEFAERLEAIKISHSDEDMGTPYPKRTKLNLPTLSLKQQRSSCKAHVDIFNVGKRSCLQKWAFKLPLSIYPCRPLPSQMARTQSFVKWVSVPSTKSRREGVKEDQSCQLGDIFPGDIWRSAVAWLGGLAQDPMHKMNTEDERCSLRYSSQLLRMRQKLSRNFKHQTTHTILKNNLDREAEDNEGDEELGVSEDNNKEVNYGPQYQAEIPEWRPLPSLPSPIAWCSKSLTFHERLNRQEALTSQTTRLQWMDYCSDELQKELRESSKDLGLHLMGNRVRKEWTSDQEKSFAEGFLSHGRDFISIQHEFLQEKSCEELVTYYYNIWKQRRTSVAEKWYVEKHKKLLHSQQANQMHEKLLKAKSKEQNERDRKRRMERKQQKKLEEALEWVRSLAKHPDNKQTVKGHWFFLPCERMAALYRDGIIP